MSNIAQNTTDLQAVLDAVNALPDKVDTSGTATAADIFTGKTATVNDQKITGANPYNAANVDPAVADALAALTEKGVDSTGKGLDDLAALIAALESGGDIAVETGTYTLAENFSFRQEVTLSGKQSVAPNIFVSFFTPEETNKTSIGFYSELCIIDPINAVFDSYCTAYNNGTKTTYRPYVTIGKKNDAFSNTRGYINATSGNITTLAGTYRWIAIWGATI